MILRLDVQKPKCMYCNLESDFSRYGEHVLPRSIGGSITLHNTTKHRVCDACNNGYLSIIDRELCSRSHLSIVASQQLNSRLWKIWDVDHSSGNQLVEAVPIWLPDNSLKSLKCTPQITFERDGTTIRGDHREFDEFGGIDYRNLLSKSVRLAYDRYENKEKGIFFEKMSGDFNGRPYRLSPRIFTGESIHDLSRSYHKATFTLRYLTDEDRNFALHQMKSLHRLWQSGRQTWHKVPCSHQPSFAFEFNLGDALRGLFKIGYNLLAFVCKKTDIDPIAFPYITNVIKGNVQLMPKMFARNGFVKSQSIATINCPDNSHAFRVMHLRERWHVLSSFFGGRIGAYVNFPGPNRESWVQADITAPIKSADWTVKHRNILECSKVDVSWEGSSGILPSFEYQNSSSRIYVEIANAKKKRRS